MPIMPVDCSTHGSGFTPHLVPGKAIQANRMDDPLLLVYTSGTTGRPKGAVLTQAALFANAVNSWHMHGLTAADHILTVLPMFHVGGLNIQTIPALLAGARVTIHDRFSPDATLAALRGEDRPSLLVLVPATMEAVLADPACDRDAFTSLRVLTTGSTIVGETLIERFAKLGVRVIQVYGATETGPIVIYERFDTERHAPGTTGSAGVVNDARIVDDAGRAVPDGTPGEIVVRGPNILSGYWRDTAATEEALRDGWFHTGDIATRDASGHFCVRDRKKNVIISGGENIYPAEIERVLADAPGVAECAVVGRPDDRWQEVPVAFVVATPGVTLDIPALEAHLAANLARFKLPKAIIPRDSLPRNALGKIQHFALKGELYAACAVTERQN
jgi:fatty-acyl-CoA synthase